MKLFYWCAGGLLSLIGLFLLYDFLSPNYRTDLWWIAEVTSNRSWEKFCAETTLLTVRKDSHVLWYDEKVVPFSKCEQGAAIVTQPVREMEKECPIGPDYTAKCDPNGHFMKLMWEIEQQKTALQNGAVDTE